MSKSDYSRPAQAHPMSAVGENLLAQDRRHSRVPDLRKDVRTLATFASDYSILVKAGDLILALGAGLEVVDLGLRMAATPSPSQHDLQRKIEFFAVHFGPLVSSFSHDHVALIAGSAVQAEQSLEVTYPRAEDIRRARRKFDPPARQEGEAPTSDVPQVRRQAYAEGARFVGDIDAIMMVMTNIGVDRDTLAREGRYREALGADRLRAGMARRLCATAAWTEPSAEEKIKALTAVKEDVLATDKPYRPKDIAGALMAAVIDAAIVIETQTWLAAHTRH